MESGAEMNFYVDSRIGAKWRKRPVLKRTDYRCFDAALIAGLANPTFRARKRLVADRELSGGQPIPHHAQPAKARSSAWRPTLRPRPRESVVR